MTVSSGIALEIHYCMGKRAGIDFYQTEKDKCSRCGMKEKKGGCCHDEQQFHKLQDSHKNVDNNISFYAGDFAELNFFAVFNWQLVSQDQPCYQQNNSPPEDTGPSCRILNCVFRI